MALLLVGAVAVLMAAYGAAIYVWARGSGLTAGRIFRGGYLLSDQELSVMRREFTRAQEERDRAVRDLAREKEARRNDYAEEELKRHAKS